MYQSRCANWIMCGFIQSHDKERMLSDFSFSVSYANNLSKYLMDETRHRQTQSGNANHKDNMSHLMPSTLISWSWRTKHWWPGFTSTDYGHQEDNGQFRNCQSWSFINVHCQLLSNGIGIHCQVTIWPSKYNGKRTSCLLLILLHKQRHMAEMGGDWKIV